MDESNLRFLMLNLFLAACTALVLLLPQFALGETEYKPAPSEAVPKDEIKCEWSKMNSEAYAQCIKRKDYYQKITPAEKREQNRDAAKERVSGNAARFEDRGWRGVKRHAGHR